VVCSLPHYRKPQTDTQRGEGTYAQSIEALRRLNRAGYGQGNPQRLLRLMTNPAGAWLPPQQSSIETRWKTELEQRYGVHFDGLIGLTNMPIARYLEWLVESDNLASYLQRLASAFNPATVEGLMCRNTLSVSWDGRLFDCDFNQMLDLEIQGEAAPPRVDTFRSADFRDRVIRTERHCFGCTAGRGSSCGGATA
jgi:radical SAM/Cys-rich protein